ncbi:hypothetical protein Q1695_002870 [Nippostrongylus brasiliensis]|nr:hypothetical protein Q1695_002870 [Nippostrongylus brasiliensis]
MSSLLYILLLCSLSVAVKCSKNPCVSDPCALGECVAEGSSYRCVCYEGYVGRICDTNRLPSENCDVDGPYKCRNGGSCNTTDNEFVCVCPANYKGFFCEEDVDECLSSPCQNGATCVNRDGDFYCMCPRGFKGKTCEERAETCSQRTCQNGGLCIDGRGGFICECPFNFFGERCQYQRRGFVKTNNTLSVDICGNCSSKIGNGKCDRECDREECGYDGGECAAHQPTPFHECGSSLYCSRVFRDGVCDEICNNEACLFDGFDCTPKTSVCPERCRIRKNNGICDPECNVEKCDFDGDDCGGDHTNLLHGELSIILTTTSEHFVRNIPSFQQTLTKLLRANVRIKKDRSGLLIFFWKDGEVGERITVGKQNAFRNDKEKILVRVEVDVSRCAEDCFSDVETVASFIEAAKDKLPGLNMSIYSAMAEKPKDRIQSFHYTLFIAVMFIAMITILVVLFIVQQRVGRKRKIIENAPVWIPPTEFEHEKCMKLLHNGSAKRKRLDLSELKELEEKLTPKRHVIFVWVNAVFVTPKPKKPEPLLSKAHIEAASCDPISSELSPEEVNRRGVDGCTPLMMLVKNTLKEEDQLMEDLTKLHNAGADLNLCNDSGDTALHMAVSRGCVGLVRALLRIGASPAVRDAQNSTCLHLAARACAANMVEALLENEEMKEEVDAVDDDNRTPLMLAAMHDMVDTKIAEMLVNAGAKINFDGDNSLATWRGRTALHFAAKYNNTNIVSFLLERSANKNCQDYECCTPLHLAASEGNEGPVKELLKAGASVTLRNDKNQTPFDVALTNGQENVVALLASGDNLRVQLYTNHGEIFACSSSPRLKCAKLMMARYSKNSRLQNASRSPHSTQSTPTRPTTRCATISPYKHWGTPHSVAAVGSNYLSPQFSAPLASQENFPPNTPAINTSTYQQHQQIMREDATPNSLPFSPVHFSGTQTTFGVDLEAGKEMHGASTLCDSGFGTMTDHSSAFGEKAYWHPSYPSGSERIESANAWSNHDVIV